MLSSMASAGALSVLLDIIPVIAGILLLISFFRGRSERKREEHELLEIIHVFEDETRTDSGGAESDGKGEIL